MDLRFRVEISAVLEREGGAMYDVDRLVGPSSWVTRNYRALFWFHRTLQAGIQVLSGRRGFWPRNFYM